MNPVKTAAANMVYRGPTPDVGDLWVQRERPGLIRTVWDLTDAEREIIAAGGRIELAMYSEPIPPILLSVVDEESSRPVGEHGWKDQVPPLNAAINDALRTAGAGDWLSQVEAEFSGSGGICWRFADPDGETDDPRIATTILPLYLIYAPAAHPLWAWHLILCVSLADTPGVPPANRRYPEAEYELLVLALDPTEPVPDPQHWPFPRRVKALHPPDALVQFHGTGNDGASELVTLAARAVAEGTLVPDSDHAEAWRRSIKLTAEHIRHCGHPDIETEPAA